MLLGRRSFTLRLEFSFSKHGLLIPDNGYRKGSFSCQSTRRSYNRSTLIEWTSV
jgi:hypothetical protein